MEYGNTFNIYYDVDPFFGLRCRTALGVKPLTSNVLELSSCVLLGCAETIWYSDSALDLKNKNN